MKVLLIRENFTDEYTEGKLFINGAYVCDVVEDADRGLDSSMSEDVILSKKVYGKTAIPTGRYKVIIDWSNKFQKNLIHILDVRGFEGIRVHSGNSAEDSYGCVICGVKKSTGWVGDSRKTYAILHNMIEGALQRGEAVYIEIKKAIQ